MADVSCIKVVGKLEDDAVLTYFSISALHLENCRVIQGKITDSTQDVEAIRYKDLCFIRIEV